MSKRRRNWLSIFFLSWSFLVASSQTIGDETDGSFDNEEKSYPKSDLVTAVETILNAAGNIWNDEVLESAVSLKRSVRAVGRHARDLSDIFSPFLSSASALARVFSYLPSVIQVLVTGVSGFVNVAGRSIGVLATGVGAGASAIDVVGNSIQRLSSSVPTVVTALVVGGGFLLLLFPDIQEAVFSNLASFVLLLAGRLATGARGFVDKNSLIATVLQTIEVFTRRVQQDLN